MEPKLPVEINQNLPRQRRPPNRAPCPRTASQRHRRSRAFVLAERHVLPQDTEDVDLVEPFAVAFPPRRRARDDLLCLSPESCAWLQLDDIAAEITSVLDAGRSHAPGLDRNTLIIR
jgi:hypothetical protein